MNEKPTHLDLFSGIGGFALAARWAGFRTIGFCEIDKYCQRVLAKNFLADTRSVERKPCSLNGKRKVGRETESECSSPVIIADIRSLDGTQFRRNGSSVTLVTGGFPCQPFSCAGKRRGKADDRHLWPEMLRVIKEARPAWVLGENVAGIIGMELDTVLSDMETIGYACRPFVIPACGVDARHRRNRVWIVAHCDGCGRSPRDGNLSPAGYGHSITAGRGNVADANGSRTTASSWENNGMGRIEESSSTICADAAGSGLQIRNGSAPRNARATVEQCCRWQPESDVGRVAHGIPARVDRLRGLGNAIVPQVAFQILKAIRAQIENAPRTFY